MQWRGAYHARHRAPRRWQPEHTYRNGAIMLGLLSGILLQAAQDAHALEEHHWAAFFIAMLAADTGLYLHTCWLWFAATGRTLAM